MVAPPAPFVGNLFLQQFMRYQQQVLVDLATAGIYCSSGMAGFPNQFIVESLKNGAPLVMPEIKQESIKSDNVHTAPENEHIVVNSTASKSPAQDCHGYVAPRLITPEDIFCCEDPEFVSFNFSEYTSEDWLKANENIGIGDDQYVLDQEHEVKKDTNLSGEEFEEEFNDLFSKIQGY
jgi:hypothetical protein